MEDTPFVVPESRVATLRSAVEEGQKWPPSVVYSVFRWCSLPSGQRRHEVASLLGHLKDLLGARVTECVLPEEQELLGLVAPCVQTVQFSLPDDRFSALEGVPVTIFLFWTADQNNGWRARGSALGKDTFDNQRLAQLSRPSPAAQNVAPGAVSWNEARLRECFVLQPSSIWNDDALVNAFVKVVAAPWPVSCDPDLLRLLHALYASFSLTGATVSSDPLKTAVLSLCARRRDADWAIGLVLFCAPATGAVFVGRTPDFPVYKSAAWRTWERLHGFGYLSVVHRLQSFDGSYNNSHDAELCVWQQSGFGDAARNADVVTHWSNLRVFGESDKDIMTQFFAVQMANQSRKGRSMNKENHGQGKTDFFLQKGFGPSTDPFSDF